MPQSISVVIPTLNEAANLTETLRRLELIPQITEIIVVDGGSKDETVRMAEAFGCRVLHGAAGRGTQLRLGAQQGRGDVIMMLHADSWLASNAGQAVLDTLQDKTVVAGGLWKRFRQSPWLLMGSRFKCGVRLFLWGRIAGDQALFVRRESLEQIGGVPDVPLMEEFILCERLCRLGRLALADAVVHTSARRFRKHGILRTYLLMGRIHALYNLGKSPEELRRLYKNH